MNLNLESVIGIVITLKVAKEKLMYGKGIRKNPKGNTRRKPIANMLHIVNLQIFCEINVLSLYLRKIYSKILKLVK